MLDLFPYKGKIYPNWLREGNAVQYIRPFASKICNGNGLDIGANRWPLEGAIPIDDNKEFNAYNLPEGKFNYIFSSHCLEHLENPVKALKIWYNKLERDGVLFLYLPSPEMDYWLPQNNLKHLHSWRPDEMVKLISDLKFRGVFSSERDLFWSFAVVGYK